MNPQVILITGCSSGFGFLTAVRLASRGYQVIATMRNLDKKFELENEIAKRKTSIDILQLDVTNVDSIENAINTVSSKYGHLDVLINNAGFGIGGFFEDLTQDEIRTQMETNFFGEIGKA